MKGSWSPKVLMKQEKVLYERFVEPKKREGAEKSAP